LGATVLAFSVPRARAAGEVGGIKVGVNVASLDGDFADMGIDDHRIGLTAGLTFDVPVSRDVTFQSGLLYSQKGSEGSIEMSAFLPVPPGTIADVEVALDYVEIPLLLKGGRSGGFVLGGLSLGINTTAEISASYLGNSDTVDIGDSTEDIDLAVVLGFGYTSRDRRFSATAQYCLGMTDVDTGSGKEKTRTLSLAIGFSM
jgi:hypothetical protein